MEATSEKPNAPAFELIGGDVCLDFINTLDDRPSAQPKELIVSFDDLGRFAEQSGILKQEQVIKLREQVRILPHEAEAAVSRAIELREALHTVFSAQIARRVPPPPALATLNAYIREAGQHSRLVLRKGRYEWRFDEPVSEETASTRDVILWPIARAAANLLHSPDLAMVRACSAPTCRWFFLDTSKNHHRRWCDMKVCGNRAKVKRFYAKKKTA